MFKIYGDTCGLFIKWGYLQDFQVVQEVLVSLSGLQFPTQNIHFTRCNHNVTSVCLILIFFALLWQIDQNDKVSATRKTLHPGLKCFWKLYISQEQNTIIDLYSITLVFRHFAQNHCVFLEVCSVHCPGVM